VMHALYHNLRTSVKIINDLRTLNVQTPAVKLGFTGEAVFHSRLRRKSAAPITWARRARRSRNHITRSTVRQALPHWRAAKPRKQKPRHLETPSIDIQESEYEENF